jgi:type I restriction enzyme S subunit
MSREVRLKDVVTINARSLSETTAPDFSFRYIDIGAVSEGRVEIPDQEIAFSASPSRARRLADPGDTIISTVRTYLRAVAQVPMDEGNLVFSTGFAVLHPTAQVDGRYLAYQCQSVPFVEEVVARSVGVSYPAINPSEIGTLRVDLPPIDQQRRIADFLDGETARIDRLLDLRQQHAQLIHEQRLARVLSLVVGAKREDLQPSDLPWTRLLPSSWSVVKLTYVARLGSGHTPSRSHPEWWTDCSIPWITTGEVQQVRDDRREVLTETREMISDLGLANSAAELHPAGTVVLCRTAASAGYSAIMGLDMATSQDFATWTCGPMLDPYYLLWCLRAMRPDLLGRLAMGSTHKTIYMPDIQSIRIPLPSVVEQGEVVAEIQRSNAQLDELSDAVAAQRRLLQERRYALITAAVMGDFDVTTAQGAA